MAKIKTPKSGAHHTKPRGVAKHAFERVYWPYIPIILAIAVLLALGVRSGTLQASIHHPASRVLSYATSMSVNGLLNDTNAQRTANGVPALKLNDKLDAAAQASANDMAARDYWSHYTPNGDPPWVWVGDQGYSYQKLGQNLATGFSDEQATINGWMASPPHRENLLDPTFTDVGFGYVNDPNYTAAGGGPMTIVVAFYGEPEVLAAVTAPTTPASQPPATSSSTPATTPPVSSSPATPTPTTPLPATTDTPKRALAPASKTTRLQTAEPSAAFTPTATKISVLVVIIIAVLWASRHLRTIRRLASEGEAFALSHPLTDLGLIIIACLLFILSQTAGLIQ